MRNSNFPKAISDKAKELKDELPVDKFLELQRLALVTYLEKDDEDRLTENCKAYREFIKNLNQ